ncbi:uroporphyrinogen-III C-methyltransferase [Clostridium formicaceticum]|uniref:uroporphyrinogen-III C-methyltransferase n=1 Tax=Clostridium formicaceticum TaxID=1497 RepID=A0AAC9WEL5_9CLOT|nr:uroporphyrinogen-III C-methyltransferase [Clostridium formicaceticum]AOY75454.1 uroporphyrinogen-III C-methyltransferase [Clostridium formicaceticum]ARE85739.1 Uroporphyrinogen-III C-methyltransferase [Clostridium formicaceticum]
MKKPYVYLVGAGPGDEDLITVKGLKCIEKADVILYDRLANENLLQHKKLEAETIDVGKAPHQHQYTQEEINQLLVDKAKEGKVVTRLKGGDPFVFGRGGEEALALYEENIPFEVVPGITSAIAVPNYGGIPVTHRHMSTSFHVITGHEDPTKGDSDVNYEALAKLEGTLVFLMGVAHLKEITEKLKLYGKDKNTPAALIHRGTTARQKTVTGTLENIVEVAAVNKIKAPSIIIIGEVVRLRQQLNWFQSLPLQGKRILVTRTRQQASDLSRQLKELGGEVIEFPTISIEAPEDFTSIDKALKNLTVFQHIIFTSVNGVKAFFNRLKQLEIDIRSIGLAKITAIGSATKETLEDKGVLVDILPEVYTAEGILEAVQGRVKEGERVLLPRADIARRALTTGLKEMGAIVEEVDIYRTVIPTCRREDLIEILKNPLDYITFTSSSTVKNFLEILGEENKSLIEGRKIASIGPITGKTLENLGLSVDIQAKHYTIEGLVSSIREG